MIGSLAWAQSTKGKLTNRERIALLLPMYKTALAYAVGRLCLSMGKRPKTTHIDPVNLILPDSPLARQAEWKCHAVLSKPLIHHSYRTYLFALAFAQVDKRSVDHEHLFVTSMLHDIELQSPQADACFAVRSATTTQQIAQATHQPPEVIQALSEAVCMHITPGVSYEDNELAALINYGALADITGHRLWDMSADYVDGTVQRFPRHHFKRRITQAWCAEAKTFPKGRAAWIERATRFTFFAHVAPFSE